MDSVGTPSFLTMSTSFLSETGRETSHSNGEILRFNPFTRVKSRQRLLRGGNEELVFIFLLFSGDSIQVFLEIGNLASLFHYALFQEIRRLKGSILLLNQELHTIVEESHIQKGTITLQIIASVTSGKLTLLLFNTINHIQNFVMMSSTKLRLI